MISIIIPVYNVERYLNECIESVIKQTYKDFEVILVDDGSTDSSGDICDRFKEIDKRINVFHKKNGGLSDARNFGFLRSKGEFIMYLDSDDYIAYNCLEILYNNLVKNNADISIGTKVDFINENKDIKIKSYEPKTILLNSKDALENVLYDRLFTLAVWAKLYKRGLLKDIIFPVGCYHEDFYVMPRLLYNAKNVVYSNDVIYFYRVRPNSITQMDFHEKHKILIPFAQDLLEFVDKNMPELHKAAIRRYIFSNLYILRRSMLSNNTNSEYERELINNIKRFGKNVLLDFKSPLLDKIAILCVFIGKKFYISAWNVFEKYRGE